MLHNRQLQLVGYIILGMSTGRTMSADHLSKEALNMKVVLLPFLKLLEGEIIEEGISTCAKI